MQATSALEIQLLGGFAARVGDRLVPATVWRQRRAAAIVKLLALEPGHRLHREQLLESLWPDLDPDSAANNLRVALHHARHGLEEAGAPPGTFLLRDGDTLLLGPSEAVQVDVDLFTAAVARAWQSSDPAVAERAAGRYRGDLLPEDRYEEWAAARREALRASYLTVLARLSGLYEERRELSRAVATRERVLAVEPLDEAALAALMRLHARLGNPALALAHYARFAARLERELGAAPERETHELAAAIRAGHLAPAPIPASAPAPVVPGIAAAARLPAVVDILVGRARELAELSRLLAGSRLVTLTGPGGVGKTCLAVETARLIGERFPDGLTFIDLSPLRDARLVLPTVARALDIEEVSGQQVRALLVAAIGERRLLLVLDNLEQVVAAGPDIANLLVACPNLTILATSRMRLRLRGEQEYLVSPLALPDPPEGGRVTALADLADTPAVELFTRRARSARPSFVLTDGNANAVAAVCRRLDGLPLAIELAAARVRVLAPDQLHRRLERPLDVLTTSMQDVPVRQRTMRAAIAWSYELLPWHDQRHFRRLAVFAGGFTLAAAEAVSGDASLNALDGIVVLMTASLIQRIDPLDAESSAEPRFRMLETIREFAQEELFASGDDEAARRLHLQFLVAFAEEAERHFIRGVDPSWLNALETEHDNIRAALDWSLTAERDLVDRTLGSRLAGTLWLFWYYHSHLAEGRRWLERAIGFDDGETGPALIRDRLRALVGIGALAHFQGDDAVAVPALEKSVRLGRMVDAPVDLAYALTILGNVTEDAGRYEEAETFFRQAQELFVRLDDSVNVAVTTYHLGVVRFGQGDVTEAIRLCGVALDLGRAAFDPWTTAIAQSYLGLLRTVKADYELAALALSEALVLYRQLGTTERIAEVIRRFAVLATDLELPGQALRFFAAADAMSGQIGAAQALPERTTYDRARAQAQLILNDTEVWRANESGQRLDVDEIVEEITNVLDAIRDRSNLSSS